jgi:hypothetical protein
MDPQQRKLTPIIFIFSTLTLSFHFKRSCVKPGSDDTFFVHVFKSSRHHFCSKTYTVAEIFLLAHMCNHCMKQRLSWKADRSDKKDSSRFLKPKYLLPCLQ